MMLSDKVALVTGASRGIGSGIARSLAAEGAKVVITYNTNQTYAEELCKEINDSGLEALSLKLVADNRFSARELIATVNEKLGPITILVNNAAIAQEKPFETISDDDWDKMMAVNLRGPFSLIQETIPEMIKIGFGRIINISSIGGQWGGYNQVHYAASKAALINLTRSIAKIYSKYGITSNAIAPGLLATDMSENELVANAGQAKLAAIPISRLGSINEIASIVTYLASDEAGYITGQTINLNGGMYFST